MKRTALTLFALLTALSALTATARAATIQQIPNLTGLIFPLRINSADAPNNTPTLFVQSQDTQGNFTGAISGGGESSTVTGKVEVGPGQTPLDAVGVQVSFTQAVTPTVTRKFVGGYFLSASARETVRFLAGTYYTTKLVKIVVGHPLKPTGTLTRPSVSGPFPFCSNGFYLPG